MSSINKSIHSRNIYKREWTGSTNIDSGRKCSLVKKVEFVSTSTMDVSESLAIQTNASTIFTTWIGISWTNETHMTRINGTLTAQLYVEELVLPIDGRHTREYCTCSNALSQKSYSKTMHGHILLYTHPTSLSTEIKVLPQLMHDRLIWR